MEKFKFKSKLYSIEIFAYKLLKLIFSASIGFLFSKIGIKGNFSPFSLSILSVCPTAPLSYVFMYLGSIFGHITNEFSIYNFKYICALTILLVIILIFGKKIYSKTIFSPFLPSVICFFSGLLFLLGDSITMISFFLLVLEALLCFSITFFLKHSFESLNKNTLFDIKDIISFCITLFLFVCALDNYYIFTFPLSVVFVQIIIYFSANYLSNKFTILFSFVISILEAILHQTNEFFFIYMFIPSVTAIISSKIDKKYIIPTYFITWATVISFTDLSIYNISLILIPLFSGAIYMIIPKKDVCNFLSRYIKINCVDITNDIKENSQLCVDYNNITNNLITKINNHQPSPILNKENIEKIKKFLVLNKCNNIDIANFYNSSGKQILSITFKSKNELAKGTLLNKLNDISNYNFIETSSLKTSETYTYKYEQNDLFKVECYALFKAKRDENICGDNVCAFKATESYYCISLADGMGSGKDAYNKSKDTISILKKLLTAGVFPEEAIKTTNSTIELIKDEIGFSTIDLCYISLKNGTTEIYKCGAYQTIVLRENTIIKLNGGGLPVGLNDRIHIQKHTIQLCDNDIIIMMSDGVSNAVDKIEAEILLKSDKDIENFAKGIIECAYENTQSDYDDDMTVIVAKFSAKRKYIQ